MTLSPAREGSRRERLIDAAVREVIPRLGSSAVMLSAWLNTFPETAANLVRARFVDNGHASDCPVSRQYPFQLRQVCDCGYERLGPKPGSVTWCGPNTKTWP